MIKIEIMSMGWLLINAFNRERRRIQDCHPKDIDNVVLNYVRHHLVTYTWKTHVNDLAYLEEWSWVQREIAKAYPVLARAVEYQIRNKEKKILMEAL